MDRWNIATVACVTLGTVALTALLSVDSGWAQAALIGAYLLLVGVSIYWAQRPEFLKMPEGWRAYLRELAGSADGRIDTLRAQLRDLRSRGAMRLRRIARWRPEIRARVRHWGATARVARRGLPPLRNSTAAAPRGRSARPRVRRAPPRGRS